MGRRNSNAMVHEIMSARNASYLQKVVAPSNTCLAPHEVMFTDELFQCTQRIHTTEQRNNNGCLTHVKAFGESILLEQNATKLEGDLKNPNMNRKVGCWFFGSND